jgi:hypothetical protein
MMRARAAVILLAAVFAVGCGDDDSGGSEDDSTTTSSSEDGSTTDAAADQQAAEDAILVASDVPSDWVENLDDDADDALDDADVASETVLADCLGVDPAYVESDETDGEPTADAAFELNGPDDSGTSMSVNSDVQVNPTASEGEDVLAALTGEGAATCFREQYETYIEASETEGFGAVSVEPTEFPAVGDQSAAFRITAPYETDQGTVTFGTDIVVATKGRAIVTMQFNTYSEPWVWDTAYEQELTELVLDRIPSDL